MNSLNVVLKRHLLAASANALKILNNRSDLRISYDQIHRINKRAPPMDMMKYKLAIQLHKIHNVNNANDDWIDLNLQQSFNSRQTCIRIIDNSNLKVGKNIIMNRLCVLNNYISYDSLNLSLNAFKLHCKNLFLTNQ